MKYYDTGTILFKNGEWIKHPEEHTYPFEYVDSGYIYAVNGERIFGHIKWFHKDSPEFYVRAGCPYVYNKTLQALKHRLQWMLGLKCRINFYREVGVYEKGEVTVYLFKQYLSGQNISFYKDSTDSYVLFGEGNCCQLTLSSIINERYSDDFKRILVDEVYNYCYEDVLTWICDLMYDLQDPRHEESLRELRETFKEEDS